jgi:hypothetical protein
VPNRTCIVTFYTEDGKAWSHVTAQWWMGANNGQTLNALGCAHFSEAPVSFGVTLSSRKGKTKMAWSRFSVSGPMRRGATKHLPNDCGVYALFAKGRLWYVGETIQLSWRMHHGIHAIRTLLSKFSEVQVAFKNTSDKMAALRAEARLVDRLRPPMNGPIRAGLFEGWAATDESKSN